MSANVYSVGALISAGATATQNIVVPNGTQLILDEVLSWGNGTFTGRIIWDAAGASPQQIWGCSSNDRQFLGETIIGDGSKVLRLQITNTSLAQIAGGMRVFYTISGS